MKIAFLIHLFSTLFMIGVIVCPGRPLSPAGVGRERVFCRLREREHPADRMGGYPGHGG